MKTEYIFSSGRSINTAEYFPDRSGKVAILFTGGIESYMVALMCKEKYGIENIVFVLNASPSSSSFRSDPGKQQAVIDTFRIAVARLGGTQAIIIERDIDDDMLRQHYVSFVLELVRQSYPTVECVYSGYSYIHNETVQLLLNSGWWNGTATSQDVMEYFRNNKADYPFTAHLFDDCKFEGNIYWTAGPELSKGSIGFEHISHAFTTMVVPFFNITTSDVIELYGQMGYSDELPTTMSCNVPDDEEVHCGTCKNCKERKYAFKAAGVVDTTRYLA